MLYVFVCCKLYFLLTRSNFLGIPNADRPCLKMASGQGIPLGRVGKYHIVARRFQLPPRKLDQMKAERLSFFVVHFWVRNLTVKTVKKANVKKKRRFFSVVNSKVTFFQHGNIAWCLSFQFRLFSKVSDVTPRWDAGFSYPSRAGRPSNHCVASLANMAAPHPELAFEAYTYMKTILPRVNLIWSHTYWKISTGSLSFAYQN